MNTRQYRLGLAAIVVPTAAGIGGIAAAIVMSTSSGTSTPRQPVQVVANVSTSAPAPSTSAPVKAAPKPVVAKPSTSVYVPPATSQTPARRQQVVPADVTPPVDTATSNEPTVVPPPGYTGAPNPNVTITAPVGGPASLSTISGG